MGKFNKEIIREHLEHLAKPRLVGTKGERDACKYIVVQLEKIGLKPNAEKFTYYPAYVLAYARGTTFILLILLFLHYLIIGHYPIFGSIAGLFIPFFASFRSKRLAYYSNNMNVDHGRVNPLFRWAAPKIGRKMESANIRATIPGSEKQGQTVYLLAHYDSQSQNLPIPIQNILILAWLWGLSLFPYMQAAGIPFPSLWASIEYRYAQFFVFLITMASGVALASIKVGNRSPGASDNAAACSMLLSLADHWSKNGGHPYENLDVHLLFTGAEEAGLAGGEEFLRRHGETANEPKAIFLNFDLLGLSEYHTMTCETQLSFRELRSDAPIVKTATNAANAIGVQVKYLKGIISTKAEHVPFVQRGLPSVTIGSFGKGLFNVHTSRDDISRIDVNALGKSVEFCREILSRLNTEAGTQSLQSNR